MELDDAAFADTPVTLPGLLAAKESVPEAVNTVIANNSINVIVKAFFMMYSSLGRPSASCCFLFFLHTAADRDNNDTDKTIHNDCHPAAFDSKGLIIEETGALHFGRKN